jgi:hypothetical protein
MTPPPRARLHAGRAGRDAVQRGDEQVGALLRGRRKLARGRLPAHVGQLGARALERGRHRAAQRGVQA